MVGGNLSALVVDLSELQFGRALLSALGVPARTNIGCLLADFALRQGVLETRTLLVDTESSVITGSGTVDLGREMLDLRLRTASKGLSVGSLPATIGITGRLKAPSILPNPGELLARGGAAVGLGLLALPLVFLPTIQLGVGEQSECAGVIAAAQRGGGNRGGVRRRAGGGVSRRSAKATCAGTKRKCPGTGCRCGVLLPPQRSRRPLDAKVSVGICLHAQGSGKEFPRTY